MRLTLAAIGKQHDSPEDALMMHYLGRLPWQVDIKINDGRKLKNKQEETKWLLAQTEKANQLITLDEHGKEFTSKAFAVQLKQLEMDGLTHLAFIIGGADGLDRTLLPASSKSMCLGRMTWPHMLVRVMLAEQIYRAHTILTNHPYHRE